MFELTLTDYRRVCALFDPMQRHLAIRATLDGNHPGQIFVDDVQTPHVGLAVTPEGVFLAGDPHHAPGQAALKQFFRDVVFSGQLPAIDNEVALGVAPENWQTYLPALIPTHEMSPATGYHYRCDGLRFDWHRHIPAGYTVRPIDQAFFEDSTITMSDEVAGWFDIEDSWRTLDNFLAHGASCCVMQGNKVVSRCQADCFAGDQIELGIITDPAHRQHGLAAIAAAATVELCFQRGYHQIGWHCADTNIGSWKTAEKVGFERVEAYVYYPYLLDPVDHLADRGWYFYQRGEYAQTAAYYTKVFEQRADHPDYYYHLMAMACAQLGDADQALAYLAQAVDHGWTHKAHTEQNEVFSILHDRAEWHVLLARMAEPTG